MHDPIRELMPLYLTGDLGREETERVDAHVAECEACRAHLQELKATLALVAGAGEAAGAPADLGGFFDERVAPHLGRRRPWAGALLRAAALLLAFGAGVAAERSLSREPAEPPQAPAEAPPAAPKKEPAIWSAYQAAPDAESEFGRRLVALKALGKR